MIGNNNQYQSIGANNSDPSQWVVSHGDASHIDPNCGGHPTKFYKHMTEPRKEIDSPSMERGDLIHLWIEKPSEFAVADINKPTEKLGDLADNFQKLYIEKGYEVDIAFQNYCKANFEVRSEAFITYNGLFTGLNRKAPDTQDDLKLLIQAFRFSQLNADYGRTWKEPTVLEKFIEGAMPYLFFVADNKDKMILTKADKDILEACQLSIQAHPFARKLLFEIGGISEHEMFWTQKYNDIDIKRKAKVDKIIIDEFNKRLIIIDAKTTSKPVSFFAIGEFAPYFKYKYGRQLYSYVDGFFQSRNIEPMGWNVDLYNVVVQTNDEFPTVVYKTLLENTNFQQSLTSVFERCAYHIKSKNWSTTMEEQELGFVEIITTKNHDI